MKIRAILLLMLLTLSADLISCGPSLSTIDGQTTHSPETQAVSRTQSYIVTDTKKPKLTATIKPTPVYVCPPADPSLVLDLPTGYREYLEYLRSFLSAEGDSADFDPPMGTDLHQSFEEVVESVHTFLDMGGDPYDVESSLDYSGYSDDFQIELIDLTGDGTDEVVFIGTLHATDGEANKLSIFQCIDSVYVVQFMDQLGFDVKVIPFDFLGMGYPQLIFEFGTFVMGGNQAHSVIGWNGREWKRMFSKGTNYPGYIIPVDLDADGIYEIATYGVVCRSVTCAERYILEYFKWDGSVYQSLYDQITPSIFRVHYLYEAEKYLVAGDYANAIVYYRFSREDQLETLPTLPEYRLDQDHLAQVYQESFSYFREILIWIFLNRLDIAESKIRSMEEDLHAGDPGYEFVWALHYAIKQHSQGVGLDKICQVITSEFHAKYPENNIHFNNWGWGRDDLNYSISELCPFPLNQGEN